MNKYENKDRRRVRRLWRGRDPRFPKLSKEQQAYRMTLENDFDE